MSKELNVYNKNSLEYVQKFTHKEIEIYCSHLIIFLPEDKTCMAYKNIMKNIEEVKLAYAEYFI